MRPCDVCGAVHEQCYLCPTCWLGFEKAHEYERFMTGGRDNEQHLADYVRRVRAEKANGAK